MCAKLLILILALSVALIGCDGDAPARSDPQASALSETMAGPALTATEAAPSPGGEKSFPSEQQPVSGHVAVSALPEVDPQVVATVNGIPISRQILESQKALVLADRLALGHQADSDGREEEGADTAEQLELEVLGNLITLEIACQEALRLSYAPSDKEVEEALKAIKEVYRQPEDLQKLLEQYGAGEDDVRAQLIKTMALKKWRENHFLAQIKVDEPEAREFYRQHQEAFRHGELARVSQIFLSVPLVASPAQKETARSAALAKGETAQNRLRSGEDFGTVAAELSDDPDAAETRGDIGWMEKGRSLPLLDQALSEMKPGQVSDMLESPMGFYILKLTGTKPAGLEPFDSARLRVVDYLSGEKLQTALRYKMAELFQKADIQIFDPELKKIYENWSTEDAAPPTEEMPGESVGNPD